MDIFSTFCVISDSSFGGNLIFEAFGFSLQGSLGAVVKAAAL
jgi:hypothetical protein